MLSQEFPHDEFSEQTVKKLNTVGSYSLLGVKIPILQVQILEYLINLQDRNTKEVWILTY